MQYKVDIQNIINIQKKIWGPIFYNFIFIFGYIIFIISMWSIFQRIHQYGGLFIIVISTGIYIYAYALIR
jgi:hypothetical protein